MIAKRAIMEKRRASEAAIAGLFLVAALLLMAPLLAHWQTHLYGEPGDNLIYVYMAGWMAHAPAHGQSPFFDPHLNYPDGFMLTATDVPYTHLLAASPLTALTGPISACNFVMLLSHFLSGYIPYLWIRRLTGSRCGGLIAGLAFMLTPYRMTHLGHLNLISTQVLPLFFWALDSALWKIRAPAGRLSARHLWMLAAAVFYVGSTSQYYLVISLMLGLIYSFLILWPLDNWRLRRGYLAALALAVAGGALLSALPYLALVRSGTFGHSVIADSRGFSASPFDFLRTSASHPLWGRELGIRNSEQTIYIGLAALILAFPALRHHRRPGNGSTADDESGTILDKRRQRAWVGVALAAAIFALGTDLHLSRQPLVPDHPLWLPAYYIGQLPFAGLMRVWARFGIVSILFVALLAGVGVSHLAAHLRGAWRLPGLAACLGFVLLDLWPGLPAPHRIAPRPIDFWLQRQPGDFAVAFLPPPREVKPVFGDIYGSLQHHKRLPATAHPLHQPPAYRHFRQQADAFPEPRSIAALQRMGFRYLLLDTTRFDGGDGPPWAGVQEKLRHLPMLRQVAQSGDVVILKFVSPALDDTPGVGTGSTQGE